MTLQDRRSNYAVKYGMSILAASVAETVTFPLDLAKTRLQIQGESIIFSTQQPAQINAQRKGLLKITHLIVKEEGVLKLWQGLSPAVLRHFVYTGWRMGTYEKLRGSVLKRNEDGKFPLWKAIVGGLVAGGSAQFLASPTDLVKVQMQMEGRRRLEGHPPRVKGVIHAFQRIVSEAGIRGLWKGWAPNVQRAALVNMGDLATYDTCKQAILNYTTLKDNYVTHTLSSAASGVVAATIGTPADVIKTRIMNQSTDEKGRGVLYRSSIDCLMVTIRNEGFFALYKGFLPIWARMAPWSLTFWLTYEQIRKFAGVTSF